MPGNRNLAKDLERQAGLRVQPGRLTRAAVAPKEDKEIEEEEWEGEDAPEAVGPAIAVQRPLPLGRKTEAGVVGENIWRAIHQTPEYSTIYHAYRNMRLVHEHHFGDSGTPKNRLALRHIARLGVDAAGQETEDAFGNAVADLLAQHGVPRRLRKGVEKEIKARLEGRLARDRSDGAVRHLVPALLGDAMFTSRQIELGG